MNDRNVSVLVIEDDEVDYLSTERMLKSAPSLDVSVSWEAEYGEGLQKLSNENFDVCLIDYKLGGKCGFSLVKEAKESGIETPFIVLTGCDNEETDLSALSVGASDFLEKGKATTAQLARSIRYSTQAARNLKRISESEEQFRQLSEELSKANDELNSFASAISHDLKQPLNGFSGFSKLYAYHAGELLSLLQPYMSSFPQEVADKIRELRAIQFPRIERSIDSSTTRMSTMIKLVGELAEIGERRYLKERVDVSGIISMITESLRVQYPNHNFDIHVEELPVITSDWISIEQVFSNLIENAIKYLEPGRHGLIRVGYLERNSKVVFYVEDNGRGISEDDLFRVFKPFERLSDVEGVEGDGMGLAIVQSVLREIGGRIWCESSRGAGSTFFIELQNEVKP